VLLDWKATRVPKSDRMETHLADAVWQLPFDPPHLLGKLGQDRVTAWRQRRHGQPAQRANKSNQRRITVVDPSRPPAIEPEDRVPAAIGGEVSREHQQPICGLLGFVAESEHPGLRVEDMAWPGAPHRVDDVFEQRQQIGRPSTGADRARLAEDVQPLAHPAQ